MQKNNVVSKMNLGFCYGRFTLFTDHHSETKNIVVNFDDWRVVYQNNQYET